MLVLVKPKRTLLGGGEIKRSLLVQNPTHTHPSWAKNKTERTLMWFFCGGGVGGGGGSTEVVVSVQEDDDAGDAVSCCGAVFAGCGGGRLFWSGWWSVSGRRVAAFSMWSVRIRIDRGVLIGELYLALPENST
ncbi:hypothetical protein Tco_0514526 [Tanacetum coccineum]